VPWGVKRAYELCIPAYLESSDVGYELYAKLGFKKADVVKTVIDGELCGRISGYVEREVSTISQWQVLRHITVREEMDD
jgi:hypothetical protein